MIENWMFCHLRLALFFNSPATSSLCIPPATSAMKKDAKDGLHFFLPSPYLRWAYFSLLCCFKIQLPPWPVSWLPCQLHFTLWCLVHHLLSWQHSNLLCGEWVFIWVIIQFHVFRNMLHKFFFPSLPYHELTFILQELTLLCSYLGKTFISEWCLLVFRDLTPLLIMLASRWTGGCLSQTVIYILAKHLPGGLGKKSCKCLGEISPS